MKEDLSSLIVPPYMSKRSRGYAVRRSAFACALFLLNGADPALAVNGMPDTGKIGFFGGQETSTSKFYCDWGFDSAISPSIGACAQHVPALVAVEVPAGFELGTESGVTVSFTTAKTITTWTKEVSASESFRVALICETAGNDTGLEHCLEISEDPEAAVALPLAQANSRALPAIVTSVPLI